MRASQSTRTATRRSSTTHKRRHDRKRSTARKQVSAARAAKPVQKIVSKLAHVPAEPVLQRFCKSGWAVLVERQPSQQGTRFVCPFCSRSHRVSGPVRGFRKVRRDQWIKLRRVYE